MTDAPEPEPEHLREAADLIEQRRWERAGAKADSVWAEMEAEATANADPATSEAFDRVALGAFWAPHAARPVEVVASVDLAKLLDGLAAYIARFVVLGRPEAVDAVALWAAHAHVATPSTRRRGSCSSRPRRARARPAASKCSSC